jgi:hypothetical protein
MVLSPKKPHRARTVLADRVDECFPALLADLIAAAPGRRVRTHAVGRVAVLSVAGRLDDGVEDLDQAIRLALAEGPRAVACDLSAVPDGGASGALGVLARAGQHVRDWSGVPLVVVSPDARVREALTAEPFGEHLLVAASMPLALSAVLEISPPIRAALRLAPHPTAPRASREFVSRTLLGWRSDHLIPSACLLVSELVTNAMVHAGTDMEVSIAAHSQALRLTVRDHSASLPMPRKADLEEDGRGLAIISGLSRAWGVLPTADSGKVVWAVMDATPQPAGSG